MNDLQLVEEETMTVKEVAEALGASERTVRYAVSKLYPDFMENGKTTRLNEGQVAIVRRDLEQNKSIGKLATKCQVISEADVVLKTREALLLQEKYIEQQKLEIGELRGRVDKLVHTGKLYTATEIGKELHFKSAIEFNKKLEDMKIQFKVNKTWVLTAKYSDKGYTSIKEIELENGEIIYDRKWTGTGRNFLLGLGILH